MYDLNLLQSFVAVAEQLSISKAARKTGVPSSTLSRRLEKLEESLALKLIHRNTRSLGLSPEGEQLYLSIRADLENIVFKTKNIELQSHESHRPLRISAPHFWGCTELPWLLKKYLQLNPLANFEVLIDDQELDLLQDNIDVCFRIGTLKNSGLICKKLAAPRLKLCCHPSLLHHFSHPQDLEKVPTIPFLLHQGSRVPLRLQHELDGTTLAIKPARIIRSNNYPFLSEALQNGMGVGYLPEDFIRSRASYGSLRGLFSEYSVSFRKKIYVVFPSGPLNPAVRTFIDFVSQNYPRAQL